MARRIFLTISALLLLSLAAAGQSRKFTLVIDAGHGGRDAGAVGASSKEKDINLSVALAFGKYVERYCPDVRVVYTRKTDTFIPLDERANIANKAKADLFVSIHTNALPKGKIARGFEVYTLGMHRAADNLEVAKRENSVILVESDYKHRYQDFDPNSAESYIIFEFMQDRNMAQSVEMARMVQQEVCSFASRPNKGVHQAGFLVLRATSMPSCLIELGFITTPDEESLLNSSRGIDNHAFGIYKAFLKYKKKYRDGDTTSADSPSEPPKKAEKAENVETSKPSEKVEPSKPSDNSAPVFKVQILASDRVLKPNDPQLKGENADYYKESGMCKYTVGASADYNEIYRLCKTLLDKFPQAFIIAFRDGAKTDVREAISQFKASRSKK